MENGRLIVGFELLDFEAAVDVKITSNYIVFTLVDFIVKPDSFGIGVVPMVPPVSEFRLVQLSLAPRKRFGEWLNVLWDDEVAVNVLATCPHPRISSEKRNDHRILFGETLRDVKLKNAGVALIVSKPDDLLDIIDGLEKDFDLPLGVQSRRSPMLNRSYYWTNDITPNNVDAHIAYALKGGFRLMSIYYSSIVPELGEFQSVGEYDTYRAEYPSGRQDLVEMLNKYGTYEIQPTADTDNKFPTIAQGFSRKEQERERLDEKKGDK